MVTPPADEARPQRQPGAQDSHHACALAVAPIAHRLPVLACGWCRASSVSPPRAHQAWSANPMTLAVSDLFPKEAVVFGDLSRVLPAPFGGMLMTTYNGYPEIFKSYQPIFIVAGSAYLRPSYHPCAHAGGSSRYRWSASRWADRGSLITSRRVIPGGFCMLPHVQRAGVVLPRAQRTGGCSDSGTQSWSPPCLATPDQRCLAAPPVARPPMAGPPADPGTALVLHRPARWQIRFRSSPWGWSASGASSPCCWRSATGKSRAFPAASQTRFRDFVRELVTADGLPD